MFGIKISQKGFGVESTDVQELIFAPGSSFYNIILTKTFVIKSNGSLQTTTIPHNLGYIPATEVYTRDERVDNWVLKKITSNSMEAYEVTPGDIWTHVDEDNLYIYSYDDVPWADTSLGRRHQFTVKYFISTNKIN